MKLNIPAKHLFSITILFLSLVSIPSLNAVSEKEGFKFVFFSDVHLQRGKQAVRGFEAAIETINRLEPDFAIDGGDHITDALGQPFSRADMLYKLYKSSIGKLKMPHHHVLGNHDVFGIYEKSGVSRNHPEFGKKMFANRLGKPFYAFDHKGWHFIILDSILINDDSSYSGGIDRKQIIWLVRHLEGLDRGTPIVIALHVPFFSIIPQMDPRFKAEVFRLNNAVEVLDIFTNHNLKLVLQGHVHYHEVIQSGGVHFITGGAVCGAWWEGPHKGIQEGFLLVTVSGDSFKWEYIDYGWQVEGAPLSPTPE